MPERRVRHDSRHSKIFILPPGNIKKCALAGSRLFARHQLFWSCSGCVPYPPSGKSELQIPGSNPWCRTAPTACPFHATVQQKCAPVNTHPPCTRTRARTRTTSPSITQQVSRGDLHCTLPWYIWPLHCCTALPHNPQLKRSLPCYTLHSHAPPHTGVRHASGQSRQPAPHSHTQLQHPVDYKDNRSSMPHTVAAAAASPRTSHIQLY